MSARLFVAGSEEWGLEHDLEPWRGAICIPRDTGWSSLGMPAAAISRVICFKMAKADLFGIRIFFDHFGIL